MMPRVTITPTNVQTSQVLVQTNVYKNEMHHSEGNVLSGKDGDFTLYLGWGCGDK